MKVATSALGSCGRASVCGVATALLGGEIVARRGAWTPARGNAHEAASHSPQLVVPHHRSTQRIESPHLTGVRREQCLPVEEDGDVAAKAQVGAPHLGALAIVEGDDGVPDADVDEDLRITGHWCLQDSEVQGVEEQQRHTAGGESHDVCGRGLTLRRRDCLLEVVHGIESQCSDAMVR